MTTAPAEPRRAERAGAAAKDLTARLPGCPEVAWIAEGGIGELDDFGVRQAFAVPARDLSGFPADAKGRFVVLRFGDRAALAFEGGPLLAAGASPEEAAFPVWVLARAGVKILCVTGGCGSLDAAYPAPSIVGVEDHLNFSGLTPLRGAADDELGALFPDLANLYDRRLLALAAAAANAVKIPFSTGILAATAGPHLETAAERAFFRQAGAHVVGQSIVVPALAAAHAGLRVLALGVVVEPLRSRHEYADPGLLARNAAAASRACAALLSSWIPAVDVE